MYILSVGYCRLQHILRGLIHSPLATNTLKCFICTGAKVSDVEQMVENHLESLIIKHFDPKKADSIFSAEGEVMVHCLWVRV